MKKNKIVISIIISIGVILTVVALILNLTSKKEEAISKDTIKNYYNKISTFSIKDPLEVSNLFREDGVYKINTNTEYNENNNPINVKGNIYYDDKKIYSVLNATYKEEPFEFIGLLEDGRLYFNLDKISEKYYYKDLDFDNDYLTIDETKELSNISFDILMDNLDNKTVETDKDNSHVLKQKNRTIDLEKDSISLTGKEKNIIYDKIIDSVKESDKFKESSKKKIIDKLSISKATVSEEDEVGLLIELYQNNNEIVTANIIDQNESTRLYFEIYKTESDKEYLTIEYYKKDKKEYGLNITKVSARETTISIFYNNEYEINSKMTTANNVVQLNSSIRKIKEYDKVDIGTVNIEFGMIEYQKEYSLNIKCDIDSDKKLKIDSENKIYLDQLPPEYNIDTANIKSMDKMTPQEKLEVIKYFGLELFK